MSRQKREGTLSERSSLPNGQLVNEQRVLLINSPRGATAKLGERGLNSRWL